MFSTNTENIGKNFLEGNGIKIDIKFINPYMAFQKAWIFITANAKPSLYFDSSKDDQNTKDYKDRNRVAFDSRINFCRFYHSYTEGTAFPFTVEEFASILMHIHDKNESSIAGKTTK